MLVQTIGKGSYNSGHALRQAARSWIINIFRRVDAAGGTKLISGSGLIISQFSGINFENTCLITA